MTTYPPAPQKYQNNMALDFTHSQIAYVGYDGTIFHISGPLAPVLGAQSGAVLQNIAHIDAPFRHLDNKGARQDGTTWYDTLYDPAEIDLVVTLGGTSASDMRQVISSWLGAWDPKKLGKLCWFSPERGEWVANVRMNKAIADQFKSDWYQSKEVTFTWSARNDQAFWQGPDSVCSFGNSSNDFTDTFPQTVATTLNDEWTQVVTGPGELAQPNGTGAEWVTAGTTTGTGIARPTHTKSAFDDQFITVKLGADMPTPTNQVQTVTITGATGGTFKPIYNGDTTLFGLAYNVSAATFQNKLGGLSTIGNGNVTVTGSDGGPYTVTFIGALSGADGPTITFTNNLTGSTPTIGSVISTHGVSAYVDIWGRMNTDTGSVGDDGVRFRIGHGTAQLAIFNGGTQHDVWFGDLERAALSGDSFTLQCGVTNPLQQTLEKLFTGTNWTPNQYQLYQNGNPLIPGGIIGKIESFFGLDFGYIDNDDLGNVGPGYRGLGFGMSAGGTGSGQIVPPKVVKFDGGAGTGHITLSNIGDQEAYARYLCYGPGTFLIADGPGSNNMISFGPLLPGQIALINTAPRLPTVVDLSPPIPGQVENGFQKLISSIINFVTNNNVPPLLQEFESLFGILPPQGPLASLLSGRFTLPIDPKPEQEAPSTSYIPCQIQGGNSDSKIVAAITPQRRWPE